MSNTTLDNYVLLSCSFVTTFFLFVFLIKIGILSTPATIRRGSDSLFVDKQNP